MSTLSQGVGRSGSVPQMFEFKASSGPATVIGYGSVTCHEVHDLLILPLFFPNRRNSSNRY